MCSLSQYVLYHSAIFCILFLADLPWGGAPSNHENDGSCGQHDTDRVTLFSPQRDDKNAIYD